MRPSRFRLLLVVSLSLAAVLAAGCGSSSKSSSRSHTTTSTPRPGPLVHGGFCQRGFEARYAAAGYICQQGRLAKLSDIGPGAKKFRAGQPCTANLEATYMDQRFTCFKGRLNVTNP
jgi:hypothetical protein